MLEIHQKIKSHQVQSVDDSVSLDFDLRQKSRIRVQLASGQEAAIFMERGTVLRGGDKLKAGDGRVIEVIAADQKVMKVTAESPYLLMRAAYHLGNRHVPLELGEGWIKLESDYVLRDMLLGLDVSVEELEAPFEPEAGAYGGGGHGHHHHEDAGHHHAH